MSGKVTPIEGAIPEPRMRQVVSYELSPLFTASGQAERYNPDDLVNTRGLRIYKQMMVDEQVKAVMTFKRDAITSRGWTFAFPEASKLSHEEQAQRITILEKAIEKMRGSFEDGLNCIARGRTYGFSLTEIVHDNIEVDGKQYIGIHSLRARDPATFFFFTDEYGTLDKCVQRIDSKEVKINLAKFVHYVHNPEEDQFYGQSDLRQAFRSWYVKDQVIKLYGTYLERFAGGFAALSLQEGNSITPGSQQHETLKDILRNLRNMAGMILPPNVKLDVVQPGSTAEYREALTYFDLAIAKALLVPNLLGLSHTGQTGAYAQSQTQLEAFFWTLNADTRRLEACMNEQLFRPLCAMNWGDDEYPRFSFKPASQEQVRWLVTTWAALVGAQAVETTAEDEAHLRKLLEMPAREIKPEDEQDEALASNASAAFEGGQVTAMLEVLAKVADKTLPKPTAIQLLVQSFPITEEDAAAMVNPIVPRDPPEPALGARPNGNGANGARPRFDAKLQFHTPGGVEHDQQLHGNWAAGRASDLPPSIRVKVNSVYGSDADARMVDILVDPTPERLVNLIRDDDVASGGTEDNPWEFAYRMVIASDSDGNEHRFVWPANDAIHHDVAVSLFGGMTLTGPRGVMSHLNRTRDGEGWVDVNRGGKVAYLDRSGNPLDPEIVARFVFTRRDFHTPGGVEHDQSTHGNWAQDGVIETAADLRQAAAAGKFEKVAVPKGIKTEFDGEVYVSDDGKEVALLSDDGDVRLSSAEQFVFDHANEYNVNAEDDFNREFWESPSSLWHVTSAENAERILAGELSEQNRSRGLSNTNVGHAVFTTSDWDEVETLLQYYGDTVIEIDMAAVARGGFQPYVEREPDAVEAERRSSLASLLGLEDDGRFGEGEQGISPHTVIVHGTIDSKYIKRLDFTERTARRIGWAHFARRLSALRKFHTPGGVDHDQMLHGAWATGLVGDVGALKGKKATPEQIRSMFRAQGVPADVKIEIRDPTMEEMFQSGFNPGHAWYNATKNEFVFTNQALTFGDVHMMATIVNHEVSHYFFWQSGAADPNSAVGEFIRANYGALRQESSGISAYAGHFWHNSPNAESDGRVPSWVNHDVLARPITEALAEIRRTRSYEGRSTYQALDKLIHTEAAKKIPSLGIAGDEPDVVEDEP